MDQSTTRKPGRSQPRPSAARIAFTFALVRKVSSSRFTLSVTWRGWRASRLRARGGDNRKKAYPVAQRREFINAYFALDGSVRELCLRCGISRKTAYEWIARLLTGCERSQRPRAVRELPAEIEDAIVAGRKEQAYSGP